MLAALFKDHRHAILWSLALVLDMESSVGVSGGLLLFLGRVGRFVLVAGGCNSQMEWA